MNHFARAAAVFALSANLCGCFGSSNPNNEGGVDIKVGNTEVKVAGGDGEVKLPADFPKDLPAFKGAVVKHHTTTKQGDQLFGFVQWESDAPVDKVSEFYRAELKNQGWTEVQHTTTAAEGKSATILGAKKGARTIALQITTDENGKTLIQLTMSGQ
jgi:hypothetical protein